MSQSLESIIRGLMEGKQPLDAAPSYVGNHPDTPVHIAPGKKSNSQSASDKRVADKAKSSSTTDSSMDESSPGDLI